VPARGTPPFSSADQGVSAQQFQTAGSLQAILDVLLSK